MVVPLLRHALAIAALASVFGRLLPQVIDDDQASAALTVSRRFAAPSGRDSRARARRRWLGNPVIALHTRKVRWLERCAHTRPRRTATERATEAPLGTKKPLSARIAEKRTQFAGIGLAPMTRENPLTCRDFGCVREILVHD